MDKINALREHLLHAQKVTYTLSNDLNELNIGRAKNAVTIVRKEIAQALDDFTYLMEHWNDIKI